jgi:hypothetical protein
MSSAVRLRAVAYRLTAVGAVECVTVHGEKVWGLTSSGRGRLARARRAGRVPALPEAPQHRKWREQHEAAAGQITQLTAELRGSAKQAQRLSGRKRGEARDLIDVLLSLRRQCTRLAWASHCLYEWAEPGDAHADIDIAQRRRKLGVYVDYWRADER